MQFEIIQLNLDPAAYSGVNYVKTLHTVPVIIVIKILPIVETTIKTSKILI